MIPNSPDWSRSLLRMAVGVTPSCVETGGARTRAHRTSGRPAHGRRCSPVRVCPGTASGGGTMPAQQRSGGTPRPARPRALRLAAALSAAAAFAAVPAVASPAGHGTTQTALSPVVVTRLPGSTADPAAAVAAAGGRVTTPLTLVHGV